MPIGLVIVGLDRLTYKFIHYVLFSRNVFVKF